MSNTNKMLIDATHPEETRVVVLRNGRVEEFDYESAARKLLRGNIYLAKVTRVEPALQAAFVDYGGNRHGFLAFNEIHPDYYQIPIADRIALLEEEAAIEAEEEAEADARAERMAKRRGNGRTRRSGRGRNGSSNGEDNNSNNATSTDDDASEFVETNSDERDDIVEEIHSSVDSDADQNNGDDTSTLEFEGAESQEPASTTANKDIAQTSEDPVETAPDNAAEVETPTAVADEIVEDGDDGDDTDGSPPRTIPQAAGKDPTLSAAPDTPDDITIRNVEGDDHSEVASDAGQAPANTDHDTPGTPDTTDQGNADEPSDHGDLVEQDDIEVEAVSANDTEEPDNASSDEAEADAIDTEADAQEARKPEDDDDDDTDDDGENDAPEDVDTDEDALAEVAVRPRRTRRSYKIQEVIKRRQVIVVIVFRLACFLRVGF
ncbi:MAG: hypothetical protein AAFV69_09825, partial [Pseudomonadota bacterium]